MRRCSCCRRASRVLPLTLLEAASYRLPLVASDIAPNREIIGDDGPGGRLFPSGDVAALRGRSRATLQDLDGAEPALDAGGPRRRRVRLGDRIVGVYDWDEATGCD